MEFTNKEFINGYLIIEYLPNGFIKIEDKETKNLIELHYSAFDLIAKSVKKNKEKWNFNEQYERNLNTGKRYEKTGNIEEFIK